MMLTEDEARAAAAAMTAAPYNYAEDLLVAFFLTLTRDEARRVLNHVGRYAEKRSDWPGIPWEKP